MPLAYLALSILFLADVALTGRAYVLRDVVTFFQPWQHAVRESVQSGHLPLWNHDSFCGVPLLANLQCGFFYPPNWLYWALPFDTALTLGMVLHLTIAGVLMRGFLRRVGLAQPSAFVGGVLFAYGTWTLAHLEFPMQLGAAVWLPLAWSGVWQTMREGTPRGLARGGAAIALSLLAGYPQITLYGLISTSLLALLLLPGALRGDGRRIRRAAAWPGALLLGALLAGVQLLPSREMAALSVKTTPYPAQVAMTRSLPPQGLLTLLDPYFHGFPGPTRYWGGEVMEFAFGSFYLGAMALVWVAGSARAFRKPKRRRRIRREDFALPVEGAIVPPVVTWFLALGALVGVVIALGRHTPVYPLLHEHVPGFGRSRWPAAAGYLVAVHLAGLAAIGFRAIVRERERIRAASIGALALGGLFLLVWVLARGPLADAMRSVQTAGAPPWQLAAYDAAHGEWLGSLLVRGGIVFATGGLGLLLLDIRSRVAMAWIVMLLADLFVTSRWMAPPTADGFYDTVPAPAAALAEELDGKRVYVPGSTSQLGNFLYGSRNLTAFEWARNAMLCNANMPAGVQATSGCEPLGPRRHEAFVQAFDAPGTPWPIKERIFDLWDAALYLAAPQVSAGEVPAITDPERGLVRSAHDPRLGRASLMTGWRTVPGGRAALDALFAPHHDPARVTLLEDTPGAGAPAPAERRPRETGEHLECAAAPNSIRVSWQIGPAGMLRVLESWDPGWRATVNGEPAPVYRADFLFLAVPVPEGPCDVTLEYRPRSLPEGAGATVLGLVGLVTLYVAGRRRRGEDEAEDAA
jgi:hypothetical protein